MEINSLEYQLDDEPELGNKNNEKYTKTAKIVITIFIITSILFLAGLIVILILYLNEKESKYNSENNPKNSDKDNDPQNSDKDNEPQKSDKDNEPQKSDKDNDEGIYKNGTFIIYNLYYATNNKIKNTFKEGEINYNNETIGIVNNNSDYDGTTNNVYDLYIPSSAFQRKKKYNKIILNIHGGMWMGGDKGNDEGCKEKAESGFICATMEYNFIRNQPAPEYNIFRILDEITSVLEHMKQFLKQIDFDENKLEACLSGGSAGAHLALLYSYWLGKNSPIPIKFIVNGMGPVSLEFDYWWYYKPEIGPLKSIEPESIAEAKKNNEIVNNTGKFFNNTILTFLMNGFLGRGFTHNMKYMIINYETLEINTSNTNFTELLDKVKIAFPVNHVNHYTLPTLSFYGGKDLDVGIAHYAYLRQKFNESDNNDNLTLIYSINNNHSSIETETPEGKKAKEYLESNFTEFTNRYFTKD